MELAKFFRDRDADPDQFSPLLLRIQDEPPNPLGRKILLTLLILLLCLLIWALVGRLDIVAVADGKLIPQSHLKIVQPAESGIVKEILVKEGENVQAGQVLMRMDALLTNADANSIQSELVRKQLTLRRIDAELSGRNFHTEAHDPKDLVREVESQYRANRAALEAALAEERSRLSKSRQDLAAAVQVREKLKSVLPHYQGQEIAFDKLTRDGYVGEIMASDKRRERIEKENELRTQEFVIESARASIDQSDKKLAQIEQDYRRALHAERADAQSTQDKLAQESAKQAHRQSLLELKAPQDSVVKDLATYTTGTVVQPGTVLLTLVPRDELLRAEVWISNEDIGFIRPGQTVKLKIAAFPFQKYGMTEGTVEQVSVDAVDNTTGGGASTPEANGQKPLVYKAMVALKSMRLDLDGQQFPLAAGMRTSAEVLLGTRTVAEYLLSPVRKAWHEAGRER